MGATDVLPYPRRRSSIQLEPLNFRLPGEADGPSNPYKSVVHQLNQFTMQDDEQSGSTSSPKTPPILLPLRVLPRHALAREQNRSHSSECLFRTRSNPAQRAVPQIAEYRRASGQNEQRPHAARRRIASDNEESTAQFIEKLRKELIAQVNRPFELDPDRALI